MNTILKYSMAAVLLLCVPVLPILAQPDFEFSTYLGGPNDDRVHDVAFDNFGNVYVVGHTFNPPVGSFPLAAPPFNTIDGGNGRAGYDVLVTKFSSLGNVIYSVIVGGPGDDRGRGIAVDSLGRAYVTGHAGVDFPLVDPIETYQANLDAFVFVLSQNGTEILFSTYLSGANTEQGNDIAVDAARNIYVTGVTTSNQATFVPTTPTFDNTYNGGQDGFLAKIDYLSPPTPKIVYKTFLGTNGNDRANALAVYPNGAVAVGGDTSGLVPFDHAPNPLIQTMPGGGDDGFLIKVNGTGLGALFFTWLGGNDHDSLQDLVLNSAEEIWATGWTLSATFPTTANAIMTYPNDNGFNAWYTRVNAAGNDLPYSSYWGGFMFDAGYGITLVGEDPVLVGTTNSANFPLTNDALQETLVGFDDLYISRFSSDGATNSYSTFLGGDDTELFPKADSDGEHLAVAGYTFSSGANGYPTTTGAPQQSAPFPGNGFVTSLALEAAPGGHPADTNGDQRITADEITAYGAAWKNGAGWPTGPSPIDANYVTNAGLIWRLGEGYLDVGGPEPGNWVSSP